jgi:hypothetical protein
MLKTLSQVVGFGLSLVTVLGPDVHADIELPAQCWPNCAYELECENWFGVDWFYCGYNAGWVYCCEG